MQQQKRGGQHVKKSQPSLPVQPGLRCSARSLVDGMRRLVNSRFGAGRRQSGGIGNLAGIIDWNWVVLFLDSGCLP